MFNFILDSDFHYGSLENNKPRQCKQTNGVNISKETDIDFVIVTGDLTENGYNAKNFGCFKYGGFRPQLQAFQNQYVEPIIKAGLELKLCVGNHDKGRPPYLYQPVFNFVKKLNGGIKYSFDHKNYNFICCGIYPKDLDWLKKQLKQDKHNIIYFHYNLVGAWSDWWSQKEKDKFYTVIKSYPISAILNGHQHSNVQYKWKDIKIIRCAGNSYGIITCQEDGTVSVIYK